MKSMRHILLIVLSCMAITATAQTSDDAPEWYLEEVVSDAFVRSNDFEYYYMPSAAEMEQQRQKGEVTYFLNTPGGLNSKRVRELIDRIMASYDDIKAVNTWQVTNTIYWKEFRFDKNKFRFSVKRKALDDGTYYVSVTESAGYYKSLGKKSKNKSKNETVKEKQTPQQPEKRSTRNRRTVTQEEVDESTETLPVETDVAPAPVMSEKERRRIAREREDSLKQEQRLAKRRLQEKQRDDARKMKEVEKQKKADEKLKQQEEKRLKKEEAQRQQEQRRLEREEKRRAQQAEKQRQAAPKPVESKYHYTDIALWLSEKYDFTQTSASPGSCTMFSTAVKDDEMAKLAIKNALKGSNARMAVPWRLNSETHELETGYTVDDHVLVFTIGKDETGNVTLTVTEVSNEDFELFKQGIN